MEALGDFAQGYQVRTAAGGALRLVRERNGCWYAAEWAIDRSQQPPRN
jgi:hypothetical protein